LRVAQLAVWAGAGWALWRLMREMLGLGRLESRPYILAAFAALAASAGFVMPAIEYRVDALGAMLILVALAFAWRRPALAGACLAAAVLANIRFAGLAAVIGLLALIIDIDGHRWRLPPLRQLLRLAAGGFGVAAAYTAYLVATGSLHPFVEHVIGDNRVISLHGQRQFIQLLALTARSFDLAGLLLLAGSVAGIALVVRRLQRPGLPEAVAIAQTASIAFVAAMAVHYPYHFLIIYLLAAPLMAAVLQAAPRLQIAATVVIIATVAINAFYFEGKSFDRIRYQDSVMRAVDAATRPDERVWDGVGYAVAREPAYRYWFLPRGAWHLVQAGRGPRYDPRPSPPAAVIADYRIVTWLDAQDDLRQWITTHYVPTDRHLWLPGPSARLEPRGAADWTIIHDGDYRLVAAPRFAEHVWFERPLIVAAVRGPALRQLTIDVAAVPPPPPGALTLTIDGRAADPARPLHLARGARVRLQSNENQPVGAFLVPASAEKLFDAPFDGISLDEPIFALR
ncbi:MAG TPA: hypothetical protein VJ276_08895, partial [Thermoanaerobaculia bacterium]|nr:hypothetical protein [Thermoanaerobaculia bacterium]